MYTYYIFILNVTRLCKLCLNINIIQKQTSNLVSRNVNVHIHHVFKYLLKYSQKNITKKSIVSDLNFDDNINITQSAMYSKEKHITLEFCKYMSQQLYSIGLFDFDIYTFIKFKKYIYRS
jgi:hypothetical protein